MSPFKPFCECLYDIEYSKVFACQCLNISMVICKVFNDARTYKRKFNQDQVVIRTSSFQYNAGCYLQYFYRILYKELYFIGRFYLCPSPFDAHLQEIKVLLYKLFLSCCKDDMSFLTHLHSIFKEVLSSLKNKIIVAKVIELFPCYCKSQILILG